MNDPGEHDPAGSDEGSPLAELSEQITRRLQAGDPIEPDAWLDLDPARSRSIRSLLPTLRELTELGRSISRDRKDRRSTQES